MKGKWLYGFAFLVGAILTNSSVMANNTSTLPATVEVQEKSLAYTLSPVSLVFSPLPKTYDRKDLEIENTGDIDFYPFVQFTNYTNTALVSERGKSVNDSSHLHFKIGNNYVDTINDSVYPNGATPVQKGQKTTIPVSVGAGNYVTKEEMKDYTFDVHLVIDQFMDTVQVTNADVSDTSVTLTWNTFYSEGINSTRYRVTAQKLNAATGDFESYSYARAVNGNTYNYTGLEPGATYIFEVTPQFNLLYRSKNMGTIQATMPSSEGNSGDEIVQMSVTDLAYTLNGTSGTFTWNGVLDATRYRVSIYRKTSPTAEYSSTARNYTTTEETMTQTLAKGYYYKVVVVPQTAVGYDSTRESNTVEFHLPN